MTELPFNPEMMAQVQAEIEQLEGEYELLVSEGLARKDEIDAKNVEIESFREIVNDMIATVAKLQAKQNEQRKAALLKKEEIEAKRRQLQRERSEQEAYIERQNKKRRFDEITEDAPWRERARNHQLTGAVDLAVAKRAILGDKTGLGKTLTSIMTLDMVEAEKILIFTPKDVIKNFKSEIETYAPHRKVITLDGRDKSSRDHLFETLAYLDRFVLIINYAAWRQDPQLLKHLIDCQFEAVVVDEAHNMKNAATSIARGITAVIYAENKCNICGEEAARVKTPKGWQMQCELCFAIPENTGDFCSVKYVYHLTATSILNNPEDLFPLLHTVDRVSYPDASSFLSDFCQRKTVYIDDKERTYWGFQYGGEKRLLSRLGSRYIARKPGENGVEKFPDQDIRERWFDLDTKKYAKQVDVIHNLQELGLVLMENDKIMDVNSVSPLPWYTRMRQALVWPKGIKVKHPVTGEVLYEADADESVVIDCAMEVILQAIAEGDRVYVPSMFKEVLKEFERRLNAEGVTCIRYDGDTSDAVAQEARLDFDVKFCKDYPKSAERPDGYKWQVILGHYEKSGTGINLQACTQTVVPDLNWNPGKMQQMYGRTNRMDSVKDSVVHLILINAFISKWMKNIVDTKSDVIAGFEEEHNRQSLRSMMLDALHQDLLAGE